MNEFVHLNEYSVGSATRERGTTPYHPTSGRRERRRARRAFATRLHRLADRLDG
jgi:hypothetical protein